MAPRKQANQKHQTGLFDWLKNNGIAIIMASVAAMSSYTAWQVRYSTSMLTMSESIQGIQKQANINSTHIKENYEDIKDLDKQNQLLTQSNKIEQIQLQNVQVTEEKLEKSIEKLTDSVNTFASAIATLQASGRD